MYIRIMQRSKQIMFVKIKNQEAIRQKTSYKESTNIFHWSKLNLKVIFQTSNKANFILLKLYFGQMF